jgi:ribulose-5-phosphate 4-epimerase/fuculose-1-phosphate aldolase
MATQEQMKDQWLRTRERLVSKGLMRGAHASLSVRCADGLAIWHGTAEDATPFLFGLGDCSASETTAVHASVYTKRADVGAIVWGGGPFGACMADFGGSMPQAFDEQARHIGPMAPAAHDMPGLAAALRGPGNVLLWREVPLCFGTTCTRLALNAELFEKCAKAAVLAEAAGGRVKALPWLVRHIANGRLKKDERRAAEAFSCGELPRESSGY